MASQDAPSVRNHEIVSRRVDMEIAVDSEITRAEVLEQEINASA